jgi:hypothetical protein
MVCLSRSTHFVIKDVVSGRISHKFEYSPYLSIYYKVPNIYENVIKYILFDEKLMDIECYFISIKTLIKRIHDENSEFKHYADISRLSLRNQILYEIDAIREFINYKINVDKTISDKTRLYTQKLIDEDQQLLKTIEIQKRNFESSQKMSMYCAKMTERLLKPFIVAKYIFRIISQIFSYFWDRAKAKKQGYCPYIKFNE